MALEMPAKGKKGATNLEAIVAGIIKRAKTGDPYAFGMIRDSIGEKPTDKLEHSGAVGRLTDEQLAAEIARMEREKALMEQAGS